MVAAAAGTLDACASTSLDTAAAAHSDETYAAQSAAGGALCCSPTALAESSRIGGGERLGGQPADSERDSVVLTLSGATSQHCKADCSRSLLRSSVNSEAPVQSPLLADASTQQEGRHAITVMTQQSAASEDTMTGGVNMQSEPAMPCPVTAAAAPSQTPEPSAACANADDSASGSPCCESIAICTAAPAWTWASPHTTAATSVLDPVVASCEEHAGTCDDPERMSMPAAAFEGHLQAALRLQPLHASVHALELEEDEIQVPWTNN